jgi:FolB domain-containing protein
MDEVFIHNLHAHGVIGISDHERSEPQEILINIGLFMDISKAGQCDQLSECVNYSTMAKKILAYAETAARYTVEALACDIANLCLENERVQKVHVRVEKPGAVRYADSVGVDIERSRLS